jgi:hypothetical protein
MPGKSFSYQVGSTFESEKDMRVDCGTEPPVASTGVTAAAHSRGGHDSPSGPFHWQSWKPLPPGCRHRLRPIPLVRHSHPLTRRLQYFRSRLPAYRTQMVFPPESGPKTMPSCSSLDLGVGTGGRKPPSSTTTGHQYPRSTLTPRPLTKLVTASSRNRPPRDPMLAHATTQQIVCWTHLDIRATSAVQKKKHATRHGTTPRREQK